MTIPSRTSSSGGIAACGSKGYGAGWYRINYVSHRTFLFDPRNSAMNFDVGQTEKVGENGIAAARQNRLRVELDAKDGPMAMREGHDDRLVGLSGDLQLQRQRLLLDNQRMVATHEEWIGYAGKDVVADVTNEACAAMHRLLRSHNVRPEYRADRLMAGTDNAYV